MKFSIVVPTRGSKTNIQRLLFLLSRQNYNQNSFEVIIVSQHDFLSRVMTRVQESHPRLKLRYTFVNSRSVSFLRNTGMGLARNPYIIFLDDDIEPNSSLLQAYADLWKFYEADQSIALIGGGIKPVFREKFALSIDERKKMISHGWCFAHQPRSYKDTCLQLGETLMSANISCKKDAIHFNENLGLRLSSDVLLGAEDVELTNRVLLQKKKVLLAADARLTVLHRVSKTRLQDGYLKKRYFSSGIELYFVKKYLQESGFSINVFFLGWVRISSIWNEFERFTLIGYFLSVILYSKYGQSFSPKYFVNKYFFSEYFPFQSFSH